MTEHNTSLEAMAQQVRSLLQAERGRQGWANPRFWAVLVLLLGGLAWWLWPEDTAIEWQTQPVDRGDMVLTATATGNLQPQREISVGAEISGLVRDVLVTENDLVTQGQVLARFDTEELRTALAQAEARLALAQASVAEASATLEEASANLTRVERLMTRGVASDTELDTARAARKRAAARLNYSRASVQEAQAALSQARTRLSKAVIRSPIDGVVLQRNVEPGTTVAASFQTPQLFLLAEDLSQMELHVALDEADVAMVKAGQSAVFTVDAWPERRFEAEVLSVYLYPAVSNNVVTYTTVLSVDNSEGVLQPGMTATATITTGKREQVMRVPNIALRFAPPVESEEQGGLLRHPASGTADTGDGSRNSVWVLDQGQPRRLLLRTGATDGRYTEVLDGDVTVGQPLLVGMMPSAAERD